MGSKCGITDSLEIDSTVLVGRASFVRQMFRYITVSINYYLLFTAFSRRRRWKSAIHSVEQVARKPEVSGMTHIS